MTRHGSAARALFGLLSVLALAAACSDETPAPSAAGPAPESAQPTTELPQRRRAEEEAAQDDATADPSHRAPLVVRVVAEQGRTPVGGATVSVADDAKDERTERTDAEGRARFDPRPPRRATRLVVRAPGFVWAMQWLDPLADDDTPVEVALAAAMDVEGTVAGTDGSPIAGARLVIDLATHGGEETYVRAHDATAPPLSEVTSGADGRFVLAGVPKDAERVVVVATAPGRIRGVGIWERGGEPLTIRMQAAATLTGVVVGPDGAPVADASVEIRRTDEPPASHLNQNSFDTVTGEDGRYRIDGMPTGHVWAASARHDGFADSEERGGLKVDAETTCDLALRAVARLDVTVLAPDGTAAGPVWLTVETTRRERDLQQRESSPFEITIKTPGPVRIVTDTGRFAPKTVELSVAPGERRALEIRLAAGAAIEGVVLDDAGGRVALAQVVASSSAQKQSWVADLLRRATSGADGSFRIGGLTDGPYRVSAQCPSHETVELSDVTAPSDAVRIVLRRFAQLGATFRTKDGAALPDRWWLRATRPASWTKDRTVLDLAAWMGKTAELAAGPWSVTISVDGYVPVVRDIDLAPGETRTLDGIELDPGVDLAGRVVDKDGFGVEGARVAAGGRIVKADADGNFTLEHVPPGDLDVEVSEEGYITERVRRAATATGEFVVTLRHGGVLRGTLKDAAGAPVTMAQLHFMPADGTGGIAKTIDLCDDDGAFEVRLAPGEYTVLGGGARAKAIVTADRETTVELVVGK